MLTAGEIHRTQMIGLLGERLSSARAAVQLYQAALEAMKARGGPYQSVRAHLRLIHEEKKAHVEWLEEKLRALGAGVEQAPAGPVAVIEVIAVLSEAADPARLFESLLTAEVYDNGGWEMLLDLAVRSADDEMAEEIRQLLREEQEHFLFVGRMVARYTRGVALDETPSVLEQMPG